MMSAPGSGTYRFGPFEVDEHLGELRNQGRRIPLQHQPLQVLLILLQAPGELVTRERLRRTIWPENTFVEFDDGLNTAVKKIRGALGDCANAPEYVETIPKRGYRFIAPLGCCSAAGREPRNFNLLLGGNPAVCVPLWLFEPRVLSAH